MPDTDKPKRYLHVSQPDSSATIDFASFSTTDGQKIEEVTVRLSLRYNSRTGQPELHVYAITGDDCRIVFDDVRETDITEPEEEEEEEEEA
jgi:hypothetical protein